MEIRWGGAYRKYEDLCAWVRWHWEFCVEWVLTHKCEGRENGGKDQKVQLVDG